MVGTAQMSSLPSGRSEHAVVAVITRGCSYPQAHLRTGLTLNWALLSCRELRKCEVFRHRFVTLPASAPELVSLCVTGLCEAEAVCSCLLSHSHSSSLTCSRCAEHHQSVFWGWELRERRKQCGGEVKALDRRHVWLCGQVSKPAF